MCHELCFCASPRHLLVSKRRYCTTPLQLFLLHPFTFNMKGVTACPHDSCAASLCVLLQCIYMPLDDSCDDSCCCVMPLQAPASKAAKQLWFPTMLQRFRPCLHSHFPRPPPQPGYSQVLPPGTHITLLLLVSPLLVYLIWAAILT